MKPVLLWQSDQEEKAKFEGRIIEGLKSLITSNNDNFKKMSESLKVKRETKPVRLVKPTKVPTWTKEMTLETYLK